MASSPEPEDPTQEANGGAADAPDDGQTSPEAGGGAATPRKRTPVQKKKDDLAKLEDKHEKADAAAEAARSGLPSKQGKARDNATEKLEKLDQKVADLKEKITAASAALVRAQQVQADKETAAAAAKAEAARKAEENKPMSDQGLYHLVRLRLEAQKLIDNKTDKNESVWKQIHLAHTKLCDDGTLPKSDKQTMGSLQARYSKELSSFRFVCAGIQRHKTSGASRDDQEAFVEKNRRATTAIFFEHNQHERPMSVPPHSINGGTADLGGVENQLDESSKVYDESSKVYGEGEEELEGLEHFAAPNSTAEKGAPAEGATFSTADKDAIKDLNIGGSSKEGKYRARRKRKQAGDADEAEKSSIMAFLEQGRIADEKAEQKARVDAKQDMKDIIDYMMSKSTGT